MYGISSATARYWTQQFALGYGVIALAAYLALDRVVLHRLRSVHRRRLLGAPRALFAVERTVTVWPGGWRARLLAAPLLIELVYAVFLQLVYVKSLIDIALGRSKHWNAAIVEVPAPMSVLAASTLQSNRWFLLLVVFVGFNTIVYAALAFGKLWPRRRR